MHQSDAIFKPFIRYYIKLGNFGDGTTNNENNPLHTYQSNEKHTVILIAILGTICQDTAVAVIPFENDAFTYTLFIPNVFTPNGDGKNDYFETTGTDNPCYKISKLTIFNRWGKKVFGAEGGNFKWDGKSNGICFLKEFIFICSKGKKLKNREA